MNKKIKNKLSINRDILAGPSLTFEKIGAQFVNIGGGVTYQITSTNNGTENLTNWSITDTFPTEINMLRVSFTNGSSSSYNISIRTSDAPFTDKQIITGATSSINSFDLALFTPQGERVISMNVTASSFTMSTPANVLFLTGFVNTTGVIGQNIINTAINNATSNTIGVITKSSSFTTNIFGNDKGSIGDFVWNDLNKNGIYDVGEPGINGVTVELYDSTGTTLLRTVTTSNYGDYPGYYMFNPLLPGTYLVKFIPPAGYSLTTQKLVFNGSTPDSTTGFTNPITIGVNEVNVYINAGLLSSNNGSIGSFVWNDLNVNGIYDVEEPGVNGITVQLYDETKTNILDTTVTANNISNQPGFYNFTGLAAGKYHIKFIPITGYNITIQNLVPNGSTPDPTTGFTNLIDLSTDITIDTANAGVLTPCNPPVINTTIYYAALGSIYDPMNGVTSFDCNGKNITTSVIVTENKVNTAIPGKYVVSYKVTDSRGQTTTKTIIVTVYAPNPYEQAITDLIESVALEQTALSHIINAEGEKIQKILKISTNSDQIISVNNSVKKTLNTIQTLEIILQKTLLIFKNTICSNIP
ncbi:MAG: SdrD B-like domain-containing protein [Clostridia bacterium]